MPGVDTAVTSANDGGVASTTKDVAVNVVVAFPAASVTVMVGVYVPDANVLNVIVLFPETAAVVPLSYTLLMLLTTYSV